MNILDLSALFKLIDIYGENHIVEYRDKIYDLEQFRDYCEDNNLSFSIDNYNISLQGISDSNNNLVVKLNDNSSLKKDDLLKI